MKKNAVLFGLVVCLLVSCKRDDDQAKLPPPLINENELITTCSISFTDVAGTAPVVSATFKDPE
jgi:hypothetical protein